MSTSSRNGTREYENIELHRLPSMREAPGLIPAPKKKRQKKKISNWALKMVVSEKQHHSSP
jgi:hypothetical protein